MTLREPILKPVLLTELRPTQITVGMREVEAKRKEWRDRKGDQDRAEFLGRHMVPVLLGPKSRHYILDHHHLVRALHEAGMDKVFVTEIADLSMLGLPGFWTYLDNRGWCHPYDAEGHRVGFDKIPRSIEGLANDPFRSLAGELRKAGGYAKDTTPFSEFLWADFLRRHMKAKTVEKNFGAALKKSLELAKSHPARYLPGWCGPV